MTRVAFLALVLVVLCFGFASADNDICDEAQFWKSLVTHKVSAAQLTSCHEVVSIVTFARESRCMQLVPATVCSFAQQYCPGIECSVQFTLAEDREEDEEPQQIDAELEDEIDAELENVEYADADAEEVEEDLTGDFKAARNNTKKEEKAQKKANKKNLKEQKKEQKHAEHQQEKAEREQKKEAEKAAHKQKEAEREQKKAERHADKAAKHNETASHHHKKAHNATKPVAALADWEVEGFEGEEIVALDTETMTTNKVPQRGPRPAPVVLIFGVMMVVIAAIGMTALRQKQRREGYRTLPDSGYL